MTLELKQGGLSVTDVTVRGNEVVPNLKVEGDAGEGSGFRASNRDQNQTKSCFGVNLKTKKKKGGSMHIGPVTQLCLFVLRQRQHRLCVVGQRHGIACLPGDMCNKTTTKNSPTVMWTIP
jgi:hypothetical protein